jgi:hypothetical protein
MKNNKSVTAVEWLHEKLAKSSQEELVGNINLWFKQAKEMFEKQIIEAHFNGCETGEMFNNENRAFITDSKQYYNETFKSK